MDLFDLLFLTWLFKDKNKNKENNSRGGIISLIIGLVCYYFIVLAVLALVLGLLGIKWNDIMFGIFNASYGLFSIILIITDIKK